MKPGGAEGRSMPMTRRTVLAAGLALPGLPAGATTLRATWHDPARGRDIPVLIRLPATPGPRPAVLVSHGLGGTREGLGYLGRALAEAGCVAIHLQHAGSDDAVWRGAQGGRGLMAAAMDPGNARARLEDGIFAVSEALRRHALPGDAVAGRIDAARLAVAGHSFGAWTVQHLLGQRLPGGDRGMPLPERRLVAGIAMSPLAPMGLPPRIAFARMAAPILHLTGTEDRTQVDSAGAADREIPFRFTENQPAALVVLDGANHGAFADEPEAGARWSDPTYHPRIAAMAVLFLRAMLLDDAAARRALADGAPGLLAAGDRVELKGI
jgi:dienelactone hydrolase